MNHSALKQLAYSKIKISNTNLQHSQMLPFFEVKISFVVSEKIKRSFTLCPRSKLLKVQLVFSNRFKNKVQPCTSRITLMCWLSMKQENSPSSNKQPLGLLSMWRNQVVNLKQFKMSWLREPSVK